MRGRSIPGYKRIPENSKGGLDLKNVYHLRIKNTSGLDVIAKDREIGDVLIAPNEVFELPGHPDYPFNVSFKFSYTAEGENNSVTATYLRTYGNLEK